MSNKRKYKPKDWEAIGIDLRMAGIYDEMRFSDAWRALSARQRDLYQCMKSARYNLTKEERARLRKLGNENDDLFFFNRGRWIKGGSEGSRKWYCYELYSNERQFYQDRDTLIRCGFIEKVEPLPSWGIREKMLYRMCSRWKYYEEGKQGNGITL